MYVLKAYSIHFTTRQTKMFKKFPSDKINGTKMPSFFLHGLQLITVLLLIRDFYDYHFRFCFDFIKVYIYFFQQKVWNL